MSAVQNAGIKSFKASEAMTPGTRVKLTATYQDRVSLAAAGEDFIGWNLSTISSTQATDLAHAQVQLKRPTVKARTGGAVTAGNRVYGAASGRVDDVLAGGPGVGVALQAAGGAGELIEILPDVDAEAPEGLLAVAVAPSTAITAASAQTPDNGSVTIHGAQLKVGDVIEVEALLSIDTTTGSETVTFSLLLGTETIVATEAPDAVNADVAYIKASIVIRAIGSSGSVSACGLQGNGVLATMDAHPFYKAAATEDISGDVVLKVTSTASSTGESVTLQHFIVKHIRK